MKKQTVIFDLDGTLINSIPLHFKVHKETFAKHGINLTRQFFEYNCNGTKTSEAYPLILKHYVGSTNLYEKVWATHQILRKKQDFSKIKVFPGVKSTLKKLKRAGYNIVVASSSRESYVKARLKENNIFDYFDSITGCDNVKHSKPNPAIFLEAWKKTNTPKNRCVIIEDTTNGATAAKRAGIDCICVLTSEKREHLPKFVSIIEKHSQIFEMIEKIK